MFSRFIYLFKYLFAYVDISLKILPYRISGHVYLRVEVVYLASLCCVVLVSVEFPRITPVKTFTAPPSTLGLYRHSVRRL
jgi:hypothetical protein